jgi:hypothetical protein
LHSQTIGRAHNLLMLEKFLDHATAFGDVWFPTLSELAGLPGRAHQADPRSIADRDGLAEAEAAGGGQ